MNNQALLTGILVVIALGTGFLIGRMTAGDDAITIADSTAPSTVREDPESTPPDTAETNTSEDTTVSTSDLSDGQQQLLSTLGVDANEVTITPEMITCAEAEVGVTRMEEIKNGDTPSFSEGMKLVGCYK